MKEIENVWEIWIRNVYCSTFQACKEEADALIYVFSFADKASFDDLPQQMSRVHSDDNNPCQFVLGTKYPFIYIATWAANEPVQH